MRRLIVESARLDFAGRDPMVFVNLCRECRSRGHGEPLRRALRKPFSWSCKEYPSRLLGMRVDLVRQASPRPEFRERILQGAVMLSGISAYPTRKIAVFCVELHPRVLVGEERGSEVRELCPEGTLGMSEI